MSFTRFGFFVFCFGLFSTNGLGVDDAPDGNFILQYREYPGTCPALPIAKSIAPSREMIEGRWYIIQSGLLPSQAHTLTCEVWNLFFDRMGILHNFLSVLENGELKTRISRLIPMNGPGNVYKAELSPQTHLKANVWQTFYFVDPNILIYISVWCKDNGNHHRGFAVGVRNLANASARLSDIYQIILNLEAETGFKTDKTRLSHAGCLYPPPSKNPYNQ